jgi:hypothetical protein
MSDEPTSAELLQRAEEKLEKLQETNEAPSSWADLGTPPEPVEPPAVPAALTYVPLFIGLFSVITFALNAIGVFGEGPDVEAWVASFD